MKVKKGIASSVSLFMMPRRCARQGLEEGRLEQAEFDAEMPKMMPLAPARRRPGSRAAGRRPGAEMIGAMLANDEGAPFRCLSTMLRSSGSLRLFDGFGKFLLGRSVLWSWPAGWGSGPVEEGDALDQFESPAAPAGESRAGTSSRTGQRIRPPGLADISPDVHASVNTGQDR